MKRTIEQNESLAAYLKLLINESKEDSHIQLANYLIDCLETERDDQEIEFDEEDRAYVMKLTIQLLAPHFLQLMNLKELTAEYLDMYNSEDDNYFEEAFVFQLNTDTDSSLEIRVTSDCIVAIHYDDVKLETIQKLVINQN